MKRLILLAASASALLATDSWTGTIVDVMCKGRDLASHTRKCNLDCAKGGYGLVLADGRFVKFNERGNAKALAILKASTKEKDIKAKVTGKLSDDVIQVDSIDLQ